MVRFENQCVGCGIGYRRGCSGCNLKMVPIFKCDKCRREIGEFEDIYDVDDKMMCESCLSEEFLGTGTPEQDKCDNCKNFFDGEWFDDGVPVCFDCLANMYKDDKENYYD